MNVQIPGWKWFPLLKGETPAERRSRDAVSRGALAPRPLVMDELNFHRCIVLVSLVLFHL